MSDDLKNDKTPEFGNTLDYYNDDLSRKAVGKLFGDAKPKTDHIDGGGQAEENDDIVQGFERSPSRAAEDMYGVAEQSGKATLEAVREKGRRSPKGPARESDDDYDTQYNFSLYRQKSRREKGWEQFMAEDEPPPRVKQNSGPVKPVTKITKPPREQDMKAPMKQSARPGAPKTAAKVTAKPVREPEEDRFKPPKFTKTRYPQREKGAAADNYDDGYDTMQAPPVRQIIIAAAVFAVILIMALLVFQLNSAKAKMADAEAAAAKTEELEKKNGELTMEIEVLNSRITALEKENSDLLAGAAASAQTPVEGEEGGEEAEQGAGGQSYEVKSGDSLALISRRFYGNEGGVQKIQQANNMTDTNIKPGDVLIIP